MRNRTPTFSMSYLQQGRCKAKMEENAYELITQALAKKLMALHARNASDAIFVPCIMKIAVSSTVEQNVQKSLQTYAIKKPCSPARMVSRTVLESYPHLKSIMNNLHLSGGTVELMIGTDFAQAFSDMLVISGKS